MRSPGNWFVAGAVSAWLGAAALQAAVPCRTLVVWPETGLESEFSRNLALALGPDAGLVVGRLTIPASARAAGWRDAPQRLVQAIVLHAATCLVVGPDRQLAHLALQMAVKANLKVVLVGVTDASALRLPIPGVRIVTAELASSPTAATAVARILHDWPGNQPADRAAPSRTDEETKEVQRQ